MKPPSFLLIAAAGSSLVTGCAWLPWNSDSYPKSSAPSAREVHGRVVPHARIQDGADSAAAFHALGRHLQREGKLDDAERAYRRALDFDPGYTEAHNALAVLAASRGDLAQAIEMLSSLVASQPQQPHLLTNLGYAHYLNGEYALAKARLMQALSIAPDHESAKQKLAMVKARLGEPSTEPSDAQDAIQLAIQPSASRQPADEHHRRNPVVRLGDGIYQLTHPVSHDTARPYVAQCELPLAQQSPVRQAAVPEPGSSATGASAERLRLELVNGNGINRLARSVRDLISGPHWQVVRVLNHEEFSVPITRIEYARHRYGAARELADTLGVSAQLRPNYQQGDTQLRVVLGKDFRSTDSLRERIAGHLPSLAGVDLSNARALPEDRSVD